MAGAMVGDDLDVCFASRSHRWLAGQALVRLLSFRHSYSHLTKIVRKLPLARFLLQVFPALRPTCPTPSTIALEKQTRLALPLTIALANSWVKTGCTSSVQLGQIAVATDPRFAERIPATKKVPCKQAVLLA